MKKFTYILAGCFVAIIVAFAFAACEQKTKGGSDDTGGGGTSGGGTSGGGTTVVTNKIIGTWKCTQTGYYGEQITITAIVRADHTGTQTYTETGSATTTMNFSWNYNEVTEILSLVMEDPVYGGSYPVKYKVQWYGNDRFCLAYVASDGTVYDDEIMGPFVRQGGTTPTTPTAAESKLIGSWRCTQTGYYGEQITISVIVRADHTGTQTYTEAGYGTSTVNFSWNYNATTEIITLLMQDPEYGGTYPVKYQVQWYGDNRFYLAYVASDGTVYDDEIMGPFVRQ